MPKKPKPIQSDFEGVRLLTTKEAQRYLGVSRSTLVYALATKLRPVSINMGTRSDLIRYRKEDLDTFIDSLPRQEERKIPKSVLARGVL